MSAPVAGKAGEACPRVAIVSALGEEMAALRGRVVGGRNLVLAERCRVRTGEVCGVPVVLALTGSGGPAAGRGIRAVLDGHDVERVLIAGVSGALTPSLSPGSLLAAGRVIDATGEPEDVVPGPDAGWVAASGEQDGLRIGTAMTVRRILGPAAKVEARTGAPDGPVAIDLESASYARAAAERGLPYAVIRAISDGADEELPLDFERFRRPDGRVDRARILRHALMHPALLAPLWRLKRRMDLCSARLADRVSAGIERMNR